MAVQWYGNAVLNLTYKNSRGDLGNRILYREDEGQLSLQDASLPWSFDADGAKLRLASEAWRIHYAHLFDPYLAVHTSARASLFRIRFPLFIRKCWADCPCATSLRTTPARAKPS